MSAGKVQNTQRITSGEKWTQELGEVGVSSVIGQNGKRGPGHVGPLGARLGTWT